MKNSPWKQFYDFNAPHYEEEIFTTNTVFEAEFLMKELSLAPGMKLLDLGCGTGRHSVALAAKGVEVTDSTSPPDSWPKPKKRPAPPE